MKDAFIALLVMLPFLFFIVWMWGWSVGYRDAKVEDRRDGETNSDVSELRECLKEAIREKCPFTRMSCKHGEPCDYECGTFKWRKVLEGANDGNV